MKKMIYMAGITLVGLWGCKTMQNKPSANKAEFPAFSTEGHRGGRGLMPENTIIAMKHAIDLGITTLEMDTHISKDGKVVVTHDDYLSPAFMLTPDGKEIPKSDAKKYPVYQMDYSQLKTFDLGTKAHAGFPQQKKIKTYIPLLSELIDEVQLYSKGKKQMFYNIETKCSAKGDGIVNPAPEQFVKLLMEVIEAKGISPYVVIQSFDKRTLQILHKKFPQIRTSFLIDNKKSLQENLDDLGFKPFILSPAYKMVNADLVKQCHEKQIRVIPWTVNTKEEIAAIKALKVDGIISDYPDLLLN
ncbi:glycerophosphoryl diester phosphodiesterase [Pedobacter africanus]|uniref:Glycerophosphoryl diester phosphodiesterase n=1 Tax=Pedobacter africanus TaxID=151894 RepID=A0ACC6KY62_9SPHI|nr:glycerophosphodiester phosphodiesterase family protein [Pedobacter africanus]MDR6784204.1 glycerophosphoryl diester phosphodiesterase [Pedobacter africanus]